MLSPGWKRVWKILESQTTANAVLSAIQPQYPAFIKGKLNGIQSTENSEFSSIPLFLLLVTNQKKKKPSGARFKRLNKQPHSQIRTIQICKWSKKETNNMFNHGPQTSFSFSSDQKWVFFSLLYRSVHIFPISFFSSPSFSYVYVRLAFNVHFVRLPFRHYQCPVCQLFSSSVLLLFPSELIRFVFDVCARESNYANVISAACEQLLFTYLVCVFI